MMIPEDYLNDADLLRGYMAVEACANGKSDASFLGAAASSLSDGSFHKDKLSMKALERFVADGYIESVPNRPGWFRKA